MNLGVLGVVAAFIAAALSLVNVLISARLTSRGRLEQWRREQILPVVARIYVLSSDAFHEWRESASGGRVEAREHYEKGADLSRSLRLEVAQFRLLAGPRACEAGNNLVSAHEDALSRMRPDSPVAPPPIEHSYIDTLHRELVDTTRADLGLDRSGVAHTRRRLLWPPRADQDPG